MPTLLSICHGGICRAATRVRIDRAHGRASSQVTSDIGPIEFGRWHDSHLAWKIGATSFVKVGLAAGCATAVAIGKPSRMMLPRARTTVCDMSDSSRSEL
jgi:hypothetical protein